MSENSSRSAIDPTSSTAPLADDGIVDMVTQGGCLKSGFRAGYRIRCERDLETRRFFDFGSLDGWIEGLQAALSPVAAPLLDPLTKTFGLREEKP